ncbi:cob(I)yrinic acid a,c-diamide adenosyltransferase [Mediterraneibacter gnavus]|uniref:cob(I)yrinic acid a,c-diamide adenosyltransferase n=1 Tax=Mediterraneibacter gnavus TaxID=33038 RepID=UPI0023305365|nr:cob(I)yrinic acid a,c-diamide adenosyltransferase [Mediterraneibacter gnavus]MDB8709180.1 cob(I)yrinic acid a,c-diamide adenosyltransferase [Mediterraneibacter gnavus]MDB8712723.1 cob(I)yrinic acid a,c-diamide adenosyltransferase [Mediterraneibacter gnavus]
MKQGMIHIYCGDGKGKTTAATGLAVRAAGSGMKVLFARFLKNENSAELCVLDRISEIEVMHLPKSYGFYQKQTKAQKKETQKMYAALWNRALEQVKSGAYDMLVMDEFMAADRYGLIPHEEAIQFLKEKPEGLEIVLTGRDPSEDLIEAADYVSEIRKVKHPFDCGICARRGIEY